MILAFDTSTRACSVALGDADGQLIAERKIKEDGFVHSEALLPLIDELLRAQGAAPADLKAVAIAGGPGSYTGLRIGASTAKGIAHACGIPMLAVDTCEVLAAGVLRRGEASSEAPIFPVLDARRMEVYTAAFEAKWTTDGRLPRLTETRAVVLEGEGAVPAEEAFPGLEAGGCWVGDGAMKLSPLLSHAGRSFIEADPEAWDVLALGWAMWRAGEEVDLAYYEPAYLKEFAAAMPRNPLGLGRLTRDRMPENLR